jgi:competence protein ComEA
VRGGVPAAPGGPGSPLLRDLRDPAAPAAARATMPAASGGQKVVSLNTATEAELEQLPGIGPALARAIVAERAAHGPFRNAAGLARVKGIGAATVRRLEGRIVVP